MALRMDPVRLLIADDVGIGKTIEAAMIARELLDRSLARRLAIKCPAHLCEQWEQELREKFNPNKPFPCCGGFLIREHRTEYGTLDGDCRYIGSG